MLKAAQLFGDPLNVEHRVFRLNDTYVIWLILDTKGNLVEVDVGPRSYYTTEFPSARKPAVPEHLSAAEYGEALRRISALEDIGAIEQGHENALSSNFGPLNTDRFARAFVDRIVETDDSESVKKFDVYFLRNVEGSPEQVLTIEAQPMVCMVSAWYYLPPEDARGIELGKWQSFEAAGPNLHATGCVRTTPVFDADGFTVEQPQNETIVVGDFQVRRLVGRVRASLGDTGIEDVNVEIRPEGSRQVFRTKTGASGAFSFSNIPEGRYKFKVTKNGFKALSGFVVVSRKASKAALSLELPVGT
jgi:hypothetical protein